MKKILSIVLVLLMVFSIAGCTTGGGGGSGTGKYERYEETVTYNTVLRSGSAGTEYPAGYSQTDNPYWDYMKSELNIHANVMWTAENYDSQLTSAITANQLPDVFLVYDYDQYIQLYQADMLADLTDVYEEYASDEMKEAYASYGDNVFVDVKEDGSLMALPYTAGNYSQGLLWVRKDWLDILGLEVPRTIEEIAAVAKAFVEQDPGGNGPGNTYGLLANREHVFNNYRASYGLETLASAMGAYPKQWMADENGKVYYGSLMPEFKNVLSLVRSWVQQGIIDQRLFYMGWEEIWGIVDKGQAGMWFHPSNWGDNVVFYNNNPTAEVVAVNILNDEGKSPYYTGTFEGMLCVRKGYEHPEIIFKIFDLCQDMQNGNFQEGYDALEPFRNQQGLGWYTYTPLEAFVCSKNDTTAEEAQMAKEYIEKGTLPTSKTQAEIDKLLKDWNMAKAWIETGEGAQNHAKYNNIVMAALASRENADPQTPAYFRQTVTMLEYWDYLESMENTLIRGVLNGDMSIAEFDTFVSDWRESGGDDCLAEVQAIYDERHKQK